MDGPRRRAGDSGRNGAGKIGRPVMLVKRQIKAPVSARRTGQAVRGVMVESGLFVRALAILMLVKGGIYAQAFRRGGLGSVRHNMALYALMRAAGPDRFPLLLAELKRMVWDYSLTIDNQRRLMRHAARLVKASPRPLNQIVFEMEAFALELRMGA